MAQTETELSASPEPASLKLIRDHAYKAALIVRQEAGFVGDAMGQAWGKYSQDMSPTTDGWISSYDRFIEFWHEAVKASNLLTDTRANALGNLIATRGKIHEDWYTLAAFLIHDIHHLDPIYLFDLFRNIEYIARRSGSLFLYDRHFYFFNNAIERMTELAAIKALPLEFVGGVAEMELDLEIPQDVFDPLTILEQIAIMIKGRFSPDDYNIFLNQQVQTIKPSNQIIINCSPDLLIQANKPMLFAITYNLAKNAAKANAEKHFDQEDQAIRKLYRGEGPLKYPMNIELTVKESGDFLILNVGDQADGLSLDKSLKRLHDEFIRRLSEQGIERLIESEWYWNLLRAFGKDQTNILLAWPRDPNALRGLKVGTILDAQFVAGFSPDTWEIRSVTSGTGLWGVRYITEKLGGMVMATNKFEGGALFSVVIPKSNLGL